MEESVYDTIETLLASVQEDVDGQADYKLRVARQLTMVCKEQAATYKQSLEDADLDSETRAHLEELGYL